MSNQKNRAHNQARSKSLRKEDKLWEILLNNQSTCDVIINKKSLSNIRKFRWNLCLQTQAVDCIIKQVGEMKGVGLIWYYPNGVSNMLSQFCMVVHSKCRMTYGTRKYHRSGYINNLSYDVTTPNGCKFKFTSTSQGFQVHKVDKRCKRDVFGSKITDDETTFGGTCPTLVESEDQPEEEMNNEHAQATGVNGEGVIFPGAEVVTTGYQGSGLEKYVIDTMSKSRSRFSKMHQLRADAVRRLKHVAAFSSNNALF